MKAFKRAERVSSLILEILAELIAHKARDPILRHAVLTRVEMGDDLKVAHVYFHALDGKENGVIEALEHARPFLRRELGNAMRIKFTPDLKFEYDKGLDHRQRIEEILKTLDLDTPHE
jgi:ribosome-binding factor A